MQSKSKTKSDPNIFVDIVNCLLQTKFDFFVIFLHKKGRRG